MEKFISLEKSNSKVFTFLGSFLTFIIVTYLSYIVAQYNKYSFYVPFSTLVLIILGTAYANYLEKLLKNKKKEKLEQDIWIKDEQNSKLKKSKFNVSNKFEVSVFGIFLSIIFSYFSIYLSEVLNLTKNLLKENPSINFSETFIDIFKNILKIEWARNYLIEYWIVLTICILIFSVCTILLSKKFKKQKNNFYD